MLNVPATLGLIALATPIVALLFEHGSFTADGDGSHRRRAGLLRARPRRLLGREAGRRPRSTRCTTAARRWWSARSRSRSTSPLNLTLVRMLGFRGLALGTSAVGAVQRRPCCCGCSGGGSGGLDGGADRRRVRQGPRRRRGDGRGRVAGRAVAGNARARVLAPGQAHPCRLEASAAGLVGARRWPRRPSGSPSSTTRCGRSMSRLLPSRAVRRRPGPDPGGPRSTVQPAAWTLPPQPLGGTVVRSSFRIPIETRQGQRDWPAWRAIHLRHRDLRVSVRARSHHAGRQAADLGERRLLRGVVAAAGDSSRYSASWGFGRSRSSANSGSGSRSPTCSCTPACSTSCSTCWRSGCSASNSNGCGAGRSS